MDRRMAMKLGGAATALLLSDALKAETWSGAEAQATQAPAQLAATQAGAFTLPALPYSYEALEPNFDAATMHLHHDKHHQAYVNNLNAAVAAHPELAGKTVEQLLLDLNAVPEAARTAVRNNGGGHFNHSFWWPTLGKGGSAPTGELAKAISTKFGTQSAFEDQLTRASLSVFGSGWAWLVRAHDGTLSITTTPNQDSTIAQSLRPVLGIDVWEHAYYLKYQNKRADYVKAFFQVVNWDHVSSSFAALSATAALHAADARYSLA
jgi:superoxide dismutase, Fe-Mn family